MWSLWVYLKIPSCPLPASLGHYDPWTGTQEQEGWDWPQQRWWSSHDYQPTAQDSSSCQLPVLFPEACSRRRSKCAALYNIWTSLAAGKQGSCQAISPKEHALDLINRRWQTGGLKVVPSAVVWTGPARGTIETANHVQEGKTWGKHSLGQKRQCGRWRAAGHERGQGSAPYCSLEGGSQPT